MVMYTSKKEVLYVEYDGKQPGVNKIIDDLINAPVEYPRYPIRKTDYFEKFIKLEIKVSKADEEKIDSAASDAKFKKIDTLYYAVPEQDYGEMAI